MRRVASLINRHTHTHELGMNSCIASTEHINNITPRYESYVVVGMFLIYTPHSFTLSLVLLLFHLVAVILREALAR